LRIEGAVNPEGALTASEEASVVDVPRGKGITGGADELPAKTAIPQIGPDRKRAEEPDAAPKFSGSGARGNVPNAEWQIRLAAGRSASVIGRTATFIWVSPFPQSTSCRIRASQGFADNSARIVPGSTPLNLPD